MTRGRTKSGFEYEIDERRIKSWSLVKKITEIQNTNNDLEVFGAAIGLIDDLLGQEQEERLIQHVVNICGYDDMEVITAEFFEIIAEARKVPTVKNSISSPDASQPTRKLSYATSQNITEFTPTETSMQNMQPYYARGYERTAGSN